MPRKQRFKPSRKPKPILIEQPEDRVDVAPTSGPYNELSHVPEPEPRPEEADAR
jgi:hypothetical protein